MTNSTRWTKSSEPSPFAARLIGRITGCTNPESAELCLDGETVVFGNCTMIIGHPRYTVPPGLVYEESQAFISQARITSRDSFELVKRELIGNLTSTLAVDILRTPTSKFPKGTAFMAVGGRPITKRGANTLVEGAQVRQQVLAFDPLSGAILGRIPLWSGSAIDAKFNALEQPNGLALDGKGNLYVGDMLNGDPDGKLTVPSAIYRIPHAAIDALVGEKLGAANDVQRIVCPAYVNGITAAPDDSVWCVSCSFNDPEKGAIYQLGDQDFARGQLPAPRVRELGILDGVGVTRRGTALASNPMTGEIFAFTAAGRDHVIRLNGAAVVAQPADFNVCYPKVLGGEPALLVTDIAVGRGPGDSEVVLIDISGL
ncbi:MAG: hypothetical protein ABW034_04550 [Steroidobacteraceae bacterium]